MVDTRSISPLNVIRPSAKLSVDVGVALRDQHDSGEKNGSAVVDVMFIETIYSPKIIITRVYPLNLKYIP